MERNRLTITAATAICLLSIAALSNPGRATLVRVYSILRGPAPVPPAPDTEQNARARHAWTNINTTQVRGVITFFDPTGAVARRANITFYQKHPDRLRVEIEQDGLVLIQGCDLGDAWQARADSLSDDEQRLIRGWLRLWPNRLFDARAAGGSYREIGGQIEDSKQGSPGRPPSDLRPAKELDVVEVEDVIGPGKARQSADRRMITYLIDRATGRVYSARWMEPDDPNAEVNKGTDTPTKQVQVDYENWRRVEGVLWPMEVTHRLGGSVDFRIDVKDVFVNPKLNEAVFQKP
jgi:hypothetical protein